MVKRLRALNNSIKKRVTFNRDEALNALEEGIAEQREKLVQKPANDDIDIRRVSQQYDIDEENRRFVRTELSKMQNQNKRISFGQAFKNARNAGKKTFWWKGKEYNTKIKSEANTRKSVTNKKSNTTSNTSSNRTVSNKTTNNNVSNNKQSNSTNNTTNRNTKTKFDSSYKAQQEREIRRRINFNKQTAASTGLTTARHYTSGYNDKKARAYLANARKKTTK